MIKQCNYSNERNVQVYNLSTKAENNHHLRVEIRLEGLGENEAWCKARGRYATVTRT